MEWSSPAPISMIDHDRNETEIVAEETNATIIIQKYVRMWQAKRLVKRQIREENIASIQELHIFQHRMQLQMDYIATLIVGLQQQINIISSQVQTS